MSLIMWLVNRQKKKRLSKLPRKRRIFEHESEPIVDQLYMNHKIRSYEIKYGSLREDAMGIPDNIRGASVVILFFSKAMCEVQLLQEPHGTLTIPTSIIDFSPIQPSLGYTISIGEYVVLKKDITSDDELKGELGEEGDRMLVIHIEKGHDYPYWVFHEEKREAFRVNEEEIERVNERIPVEII